jgi:molecular chaperone GrpE
MAGSRVMERENREAKIKEDPQGEFEVQAEGSVGPENQGEKEIPLLEDMKKEDLLARVEAVQGLADKNFDLYLRSQAEIENLKKRFQKEKEGLIKFSTESLVKQLLPVADNLEKALEHAVDESSFNALREGVELTLKGLRDTLKKVGVEEVQAIGEPFDPNFHEALCEQEDNCVQSGTVLQELQKGYVLNKRLLRPARVVVSKGKAQD